MVIGAGIGGLTTAALLQQAGYEVTVLEAQTYPGGCASTYYHKGFRFESGATVVGGFQPNGPHALIENQLNIKFPVRQHDPAWVTHLPDRAIALTADNADVLEKFPHTAKFWRQQSQIAGIAWNLSAQGLPFPPRSSAEFWQLLKVGIRNLPQDLRILPFAFMSVYQWLWWHGLHTDKAFVRFLDAQLLISAQTTTRYVNALYGATALDLARQGVFHIETGIGGIAQTLVDKFTALGGTIHYRWRVNRIEIKQGQASGVYAKHGKHAKNDEFFPADFVIANTTPWNLQQLLGENVDNQQAGWGAFVLHLGVNADIFPPDFPDHHQIIRDMDSPLGEGNSLFLSLSPTWDSNRAPAGQRAMTITTHTNVKQWWQADDYDGLKAIYTERILNTVERLIPGFKDNLTLILPGTPITYQRYTERYMGMVGGFPQTSLFKSRSPRTGIKNVRLVGDSIFPGQSTAGVTLGAIRVAEDVKRNLALKPVQQSQMELA